MAVPPPGLAEREAGDAVEVAWVLRLDEIEAASATLPSSAVMSRCVTGAPSLPDMKRQLQFCV
jgi:hypothetical protein